jgi:hypothetical protein
VDKLARSPSLRIHGEGGERSRTTYSVQGILRSPSLADRDDPGPAVSVAMTLFRAGKPPSWSGVAARPHEKPVPVPVWLDLSDALLDYLGETADE